MTDNLLLDHISPTRTSSSSVVDESLEEICLNNGINPSKIKQKGLLIEQIQVFRQRFEVILILTILSNLAATARIFPLASLQ